MSGETAPQSDLERLIKALEEFNKTHDPDKLAEINYNLGAAVVNLTEAVKVLSGQMGFLGDLLAQREAERAPEMQRDKYGGLLTPEGRRIMDARSTPPPSREGGGPDFEAIGWRIGNRQTGVRAANAGQDGWAGATFDEGYDDDRVHRLKDELRTMIEQQGQARVEMAGILFDVTLGRTGRFFNRKRVQEGGRR